jgi:hypothetical protein
MADSIMSTNELFKFLFNVRTHSNGFIAISYDLDRVGPTLGLNFGLNLGPVWRSSGSNFGPELDCSTTMSLCTMTSTGVTDNDQMVLNNGELDVEGNGSTASNHSNCSNIEDS